MTDSFLANVVQESIEGGTGAVLDVFPLEREMDAIYRLEVTATDLAGNVSTTDVTFCVCRFGSVYIYEDYLSEVNGQYIQELTGDLIITELNPAGIVNESTVIQVTRDGAPVTVDAVIESADAEDGAWAENRYTLSKDMFAEGGMYEVLVSTMDEAGNLPENTDEDTVIRFAVDQTAPELTSVVGLENAIVKADSLKVTFSAMDNVALAEVTVYLDGEAVKTWTEESGYALDGSFEIPSGVETQVRIVAKDKAGNVLDTAQEDFAPGYGFEDTITVNTNPLLRFYANKPLLYGSGAAGAAGLTAVVAAISRSMKKKRDKIMGKGEDEKGE